MRRVFVWLFTRPSWFRRWRAEGQDEWKPTGIKQLHTGYLQHKASASYQRSRGQSETGRPYARTQGNVVSLTRRAK
jgi:hypothetical protein